MTIKNLRVQTLSRTTGIIVFEEEGKPFPRCVDVALSLFDEPGLTIDKKLMMEADRIEASSQTAVVA